MLATFSILVGLPQSTQAAAGTNQQINFQARLLNSQGATVPDGNYNIQFKIYQDGNGCVGGGTTPCGGTLQWTESWLNNNTQGVTVKNGYFSVYLGSITTLSAVDFNQDTLWLSLNVGNTNATCTPFTNCAPDTEMLPFKRFASNAYALNSGRLGGFTSSQFVQLAQGMQTDSSTANASIAINKTGGTANILDLQRGSVSVALIDNNGTTTLQGTGNSATLLVKQNANASPTADIFNVLGANGTTKFIGVVSTAANQGTVTVQSVGGSNALTLTSAGAATWSTTSGTVSLGSSTSLAANAALTLQSGGAGALTLASGSGTILTGSIISSTNNITTSGNISTSGTGTITSAGAFSGPTATNTINNLVINNGSLSNVGNVTTAAGSTFQTTGATGFTFKPGTNNATAFQFQNTASDTILGIDTSSNNTTNIVTNPSFEADTTGWAGRNTTAITRVTSGTTQPYFGNASLQVANNTTAGSDGAKFSYSTGTLTNGSIYTLVFYVKASSGNFATFEMGNSNDGTALTSCLTAQTVVTNGWTRLACSFRAGAQSGTPFVYARQTDNTTTARTFFIDAATLETGANTTTNYREGKISFGGTVTSPLIVQNTDNSSNALQVQNSSGASVFTIDTTDTNLLSNPGQEVNLNGWALKGAAGIVVSRDTSAAYSGFSSLKVVTTALAQDGTKFTYANTLLTSGTTYTLSFYAKIATGSIATLTFGRADNGVAETNCVTTGILTVNWTRFSCSFAAGAQSGSPYIFISQGTTATSQTINIDGVQLEVGATATAYGAGMISLNGVINTPIAIQNKTDSTSAFSIQKANGTALFSVDTSNMVIAMNGTSTVPPLSSASTGKIYYDTTRQHFQVSENGGAYQDINGMEYLGGFEVSSATVQANMPIVNFAARDQLIIVCRVPSFSVADRPAMQFGSGGSVDTANNYWWHHVTVAPGAINSVSTSATTTNQISGTPAASAVAQTFMMIVANRAATTKAVIAPSATATGVVGTASPVGGGGGEWVNTANQITALKLKLTSNNTTRTFAAESGCGVWGKNFP